MLSQSFPAMSVLELFVLILCIGNFFLQFFVFQELQHIKQK